MTKHPMPPILLESDESPFVKLIHSIPQPIPTGDDRCPEINLPVYHDPYLDHEVRSYVRCQLETGHNGAHKASQPPLMYCEWGGEDKED